VRNRITTLLTCVAALAFLTGADWRQFRGTENQGVSGLTDLPITFSEEEGVAWKIPLPGRGPSSPIVVDGRVIVTCSSGAKEDRLHVLCFDVASGRLHWHRQLWATGHTVLHPFGANAAPTPASDGQLVFAFFSSNDLACFDLDGNLKWFRGLAFDYPAARNDVGMSSSPIVLGDVVIVQVENPGESFAAGIDITSGKTRWRIERDKSSLWASPTVFPGKIRDEDLVLLQSRSKLTAHDPRTGETVWEYEAPCHTIASATTAGDIVYLPANGLNALRYDRASDSVELLWQSERLRSNNSSPIVHQGRTYTIKAPSILVCGDAADGSVVWQVRLKGTMWATPVLAAGRLYCINQNGLVQVVSLGQKGKLVGSTQLEQGMLASPAVAAKALFLRSDGHLWKVSSTK